MSKRLRRIVTLLTVMTLVFSPLISTNASAAPGASYVATGATHACAVMKGNVKCWGSNTSGQLGNDTVGITAVTEPVDVVSKKAWTETIPKSQECFAFFCRDIPAKTVNHPKTGLEGRTVTKVSAGATHTCAIADAKLFCWGSNLNGQLGNNKAGLIQEKIPVAVVTDTGALKDKEIIDVSAADNFTCALASDGMVACWGVNNNGQLGINARGSKKVPTAVHTGDGSALAGKKTFQLSKASGSTMCGLTIPAASNAIEEGGEPVCWGYGIDDGSATPGNSNQYVNCGKSSPTTKPTARSETKIFSSLKPVLIPGAKLKLADGNEYVTGITKQGQAMYWGMYGYTKDTNYSNIDSCKVDCKGKVTIQATVVLAGMKRVSPGSGDRGPNKEYRKDSCNETTHYGYSESTRSYYVGRKTATIPVETSTTKNISLMSGGMSNLFCTVSTTGAGACDAYGTNVLDGRTGSGYERQCTKNGWITTCAPLPSGPQPLVTSGWLSGKSITQLSTGSSGYTCAVASGSVGCWGVNTRGQLGVGDTTNRNVATGVKL